MDVLEVVVFVPYLHIKENSLPLVVKKILKELDQVVDLPEFKGYISDLGDPCEYVQNER